MSTSKYFHTLFNETDWVCAGSSPRVRSSSLMRHVLQRQAPPSFVCLNALEPYKTRSRINVCCYRNFLLEFDNLTLADQRDLILSSHLPHSTRTFSGGKSIHIVISLEEPLTSLDEWRFISDWLYAAFPQADRACNDVARLTRVADGLRQTDTGWTCQTGEYVGGRVPNAELLEYLEAIVEPPQLNKFQPHEDPGSTVPEEYLGFGPDFRGTLSAATMDFVRTGGASGQRRKALFKAACDFRDQRYTFDDACTLLLERLTDIYRTEGRPDTELLDCKATIYDAYMKYKPNPPRF